MKDPFIGGSETPPDNASMLCLACRTPTRHHTARLALAALALWAAALAGPSAFASGNDDHDRARQAVQAGQVLPLPAVLERLQREVPGKVLEVELEQERGSWIYEIKLLTPAGQLTKVKLDARTGEVLRVHSREDRRRSRENR